MQDEIDEKHAMMQFCRGVFGTSNLIGTDFDDVQVFKVTGRDFPQQPGGDGLHVTFSISWHAIGKTGREAHDALDVLLPDEDAN
jgi:hypothetical protein